MKYILKTLSVGLFMGIIFGVIGIAGYVLVHMNLFFPDLSVAVSSLITLFGMIVLACISVAIFVCLMYLLDENDAVNGRDADHP